MTPNPVLKGGTLTLKNLMQIATAAHLNSVDYAITGGASGTLPASFDSVNATTPITAPGTAGNYTMTLTWNYLDHAGASRQASAQLPFQTIDFQPSPVLKITTDAAGTQIVGVFGTPPAFSLTTGTTYYLWDGESLPPGFSAGAAFFKSSDSNTSISSGDTQIGTSTGAGPVTFAPGACASSCFIKVQVAGVVTAWAYTARTGSGGGGGGGGRGGGGGGGGGGGSTAERCAPSAFARLSHGGPDGCLFGVGGELHRHAHLPVGFRRLGRIRRHGRLGRHGRRRVQPAGPRELPGRRGLLGRSESEHPRLHGDGNLHGDRPGDLQRSDEDVVDDR